MGNWALIAIFISLSQPGQTAATTIQGFSSLEACRQAGAALTETPPQRGYATTFDCIEVK